jgi:hypothetical protein
MEEKKMGIKKESDLTQEKFLKLKNKLEAEGYKEKRSVIPPRDNDLEKGYFYVTSHRGSAEIFEGGEELYNLMYLEEGGHHDPVIPLRRNSA